MSQRQRVGVGKVVVEPEGRPEAVAVVEAEVVVAMGLGGIEVEVVAAS